MRPEVIDYAVQEFERQLLASLAVLDNKAGRIRQRAQELQEEIAEGLANLKALKNNPTLVNAINKRQEELDDITRQLLTTAPDSLSVEIGRIRQFVIGQLGDIRQLLNVDVQKAKAQFGEARQQHTDGPTG